MHGRLKDCAVLRRADVGALELIERGDLSFDEFTDASIDLAHFLRNLAGEVLVDLDDLQLQLGDLAFGLRGCCDQLSALGASPAAVAGMVVDGIRARRFYILTSENRNEAIRRRGEEIVAGGPPELPVSFV